MTRISSFQTLIIKRVFPVGLVLMMGIVGYVLLSEDQKPPPQAIAIVVAILAVNVVVFWRQVRGLADEVVDGGTYLLVRKGGVEERVQLVDVINVDMQRFGNPRRITLRLRRPGRLGDEIAFIPQHTFQFNPFARHPLAESLISRIDRLRQQA